MSLSSFKYITSTSLKIRSGVPRACRPRQACEGDREELLERVEAAAALRAEDGVGQQRELRAAPQELRARGPPQPASKRSRISNTLIEGEVQLNFNLKFR